MHQVGPRRPAHAGRLTTESEYNDVKATIHGLHTVFPLCGIEGVDGDWKLGRGMSKMAPRQVSPRAFSNQTGSFVQV